jgi:hypothetical protein
MLLKLNFVYFFGSFCIGLFFCYLLSPPIEIVYKFPSPLNAGKIKYKSSESDTCYVYKAENVACPLDKGNIRPQPGFML